MISSTSHCLAASATIACENLTASETSQWSSLTCRPFQFDVNFLSGTFSKGTATRSSLPRRKDLFWHLTLLDSDSWVAAARFNTGHGSHWWHKTAAPPKKSGAHFFRTCNPICLVYLSGFKTQHCLCFRCISTHNTVPQHVGLSQKGNTHNQFVWKKDAKPQHVWAEPFETTPGHCPPTWHFSWLTQRKAFTLRQQIPQTPMVESRANQSASLQSTALPENQNLCAYERQLHLPQKSIFQRLIDLGSPKWSADALSTRKEHLPNLHMCFLQAICPAKM